ncbi:hypothetical protein FOB64_005461 [Candida albicans]|uniref:Uncharacterized protein n=1 Tax=Candida albicans TaxID=5476 RepID=A0A8H6BVZ4_CANAX|nr:hypothetical protein FOB64_005461 [Candida albicans]
MFNGSKAAASTVMRWIPKAEWGCHADPSGRYAATHDHKRKGKGYIKVDGSKLPQDFKLPTLIFHYTDLLNFTNLPNVEKYFDDYAKHQISDSLLMTIKVNLI